MAIANLTAARPAGSRAPTIAHNCKTCGKPFMAHATVQNVCSVECRFLMYQNKGEPNACWEWNGPRVETGYGTLCLPAHEDGRRNSIQAHRYSYIRTNGPLPSDKPCVLHSCDNPCCTNPNHLRAGTQGENNSERSAKGRSGSRKFSDAERLRYSEMLRGENSRNAKLTLQQALTIKYGHGGLSAREVAAIYGVEKSTVKHIRTGKNWRHI